MNLMDIHLLGSFRLSFPFWYIKWKSMFQEYVFVEVSDSEFEIFLAVYGTSMQ